MAYMPQVGVDVTPGENPMAMLRWLAQNTPGSGATWQTATPTLESQLAAAAPATEQVAAKAGKLGALKAILSDVGAVKAGEMSIPEFLATHGTAAGIGAGLVAQVAAQPVGSFLGKETNNPDFGNFASDTLKGAGIGAGIGSVVPVIGTGLGALGGAAIGALIGSKHHASPAEQLAKAESQAWTGLAGIGVDAPTLKAVQDEYQTLKQTQGQQAAISYLQQVQQYQGSQAQLPGLPSSSAASGGMSPENILKLQTSLAGLVTPYVQQEQKANDAEIQAMMAASTPAGQKISAATQHLGDMYRASGDRISNAYILQALAQPSLDAITSTYYNKGLQARATGGGTGSLASMLLGNTGVASASSSGQANVNPALTASQYGAGNQLLIQ